jgi:hypothetical protein
MVGALPNDAYILTVALKAELEAIKKGDYMSTVDYVDFPDYRPEDEIEWIPAKDGKVVHVWAIEDGLTGDENSNNLKPALRILVLGAVKAPAMLQIEMMKLKGDLRRVLIDNGDRTFPGLDGGDQIAYYTREVRPFLYSYHPDKVGSLRAIYDVHYNQPPSG